MQTIALGNSGMRCSRLGFGCASVMGRVGRKLSLAALGAAYDAGISFFDTARSYGYGEGEALLGEFLSGRRSSVLISTKFGILPAPGSRVKRVLKPVARGLLRLAPGVRDTLQSRLAAQSSSGHFSVAALNASLNTSLQALRTDYVDFLFLHEPPASVLQQEDVFAALEQVVAAGKVRCVGVASSPDGVEASLAAERRIIESVQLPCNFLRADAAIHAIASRSDLALIGTHPLGGAAGVATLKARLGTLATNSNAAQSLREKLYPRDGSLLADVALNIITQTTPIQVVVSSMLQLDHLRVNVSAIERSRFSDEELHWLRAVLSVPETPKATQPA